MQNLTSADLDLSGYQLTDDSNHQDVWTVPNGVSIPANGYLVIFASGLDTDGYHPTRNWAVLHQFPSSAEKPGTTWALLSTSGELIQEFAPMIPPQVADVAYGLMDGEFQYS
ncbi:MAG: lamin tail domain-containing protein [Pirellulaceae bacterium]